MVRARVRVRIRVRVRVRIRVRIRVRVRARASAPARAEHEELDELREAHGALRRLRPSSRLSSCLLASRGLLPRRRALASVYWRLLAVVVPG